MEWVRYANIGIAVGVTILVIAVLVFRNSSEAAMQAVALVGMFIGLGVALFLEERARKRKEGRSQ